MTHYNSKLRSCLTLTASAVVVRLGIASQIGSTSGPSKSPAPSQPQHHTTNITQFGYRNPNSGATHQPWDQVQNLALLPPLAQTSDHGAHTMNDPAGLYEGRQVAHQVEHILGWMSNFGA